MRKLITISIVLFFMTASAAAQTIKVDYMTKVPRSIQECGALYTYDTANLQKKKYIMMADFQNQGVISINGKLIKLLLKDTNLSTNKKVTTANYTGSGYTVNTTVSITKTTTLIDYESGTLTISKGNNKVTIKIHGQSGCDEKKIESN